MNANSQIAKGGACKANDNKGKLKLVNFFEQLNLADEKWFNLKQSGK